MLKQHKALACCVVARRVMQQLVRQHHGCTRLNCVDPERYLASLPGVLSFAAGHAPADAMRQWGGRIHGNRCALSCCEELEKRVAALRMHECGGVAVLVLQASTRRRSEN